MKVFETPVIEVTKFTAEDIMTNSDTCAANCPDKGALPWD